MNTAPAFPRYLWFLTLSYTVILILSNWFNARLIHVFGIDTDSGTLVFPLTFILSDMITEVYGFKQARRAIWCGFLFNALFILYSQIVIHLPGPDYPNNNHLFDEILSINTRIIFASAFSYLCAEPLNSLIMAKLKIRLNGKWMGPRFIVSTFFAAGLDSALFTGIAFFGTMAFENLLSLFVTMWLIKVCMEIVLIPLSTPLTTKLKRLEKTDMYDRHTKFSLFSLDASYLRDDNRFIQSAKT